MSSFPCLRLLRCSLNDSVSSSASRCSRPARTPATAAFSTSSSTHFPPPVKKVSGPSQTAKGKKQLVIKKKIRVKTGKPPMPGERKAMRKRIVLSNTNALVVPGLQELTVDDLAMIQSVGKMFSIPGKTIDSLRAVEAFKPRQGWKLFRKPSVAWRREARDMADLADTAVEEEKKTIRKMIVGEWGSGKSTMLLQAMAMAFLKRWVVVNIPDAEYIVNASSDYAPISGTEPLQYAQNTYTARLLTQIGEANKEVLSMLKVTQQHSIPIPLSSETTLERLVAIGGSDPDSAWPIFQALWKELMAPSGKDAGSRPPVLLCTDGAHHIMRDSKYMSAEFKPIHAHDLALVNHFNAYLSGSESLTNGGMVLAATSASSKPKSEALDFAIEQNEAAQNPDPSKPEPFWNPYRKLDQRVMHAMSGVEILRLGGLSKLEATSVMNYYAGSGILRQTVSDALISEKWSLSGGGIIGELERNVLWRS